MSSRRRTSVWAITATIAGVVGAGAAVYQVLQTRGHGAYLTYSQSISEYTGGGVKRSPVRLFDVTVNTLDESIILSGRWYIKRLPWWHFRRALRKGEIVARHGGIGEYGRPKYLSFTDVAINTKEKGYLFVDLNLIRYDLHRGPNGQYELGIEYKWKGGTSWARTTLPFCVER